MYEAIACAIRTSNRPKHVMLAKSLFPNDLKVLQTIVQETGIEFSFVEIDPTSGLLNLGAIEQELTDNTNQYSAFVFPQVNALGLLENVDAITDFCQHAGVRSIVSVDP